jgi:hypothetical protein
MCGVRRELRVGVGAECWACVMHVSCAVSPCVDCGACTVVQLCHLSVCCVACCLLCRLWVHALRCLIYIYSLCVQYQTEQQPGPMMSTSITHQGFLPLDRRSPQGVYMATAMIPDPSPHCASVRRVALLPKGSVSGIVHQRTRSLVAPCTPPGPIS